MKKLFATLLAVSAIFALTADDVLVWKPDFTKLNRKNSGTGIWYHVPSGMECKAEYFKDKLVLTVVKNPAKALMSAQGLVLYTGKYQVGDKYEVSFKIKSNKDVKIWAAATMSKAPWKSFKGKYMNLTANEEEEEDIEFTIPEGYDGRGFRMLYLGLGLAPEGTVFEISDVKLEKEVEKK